MGLGLAPTPLIEAAPFDGGGFLFCACVTGSGIVLPLPQPAKFLGTLGRKLHRSHPLSPHAPTSCGATSPRLMRVVELC